MRNQITDNNIHIISSARSDASTPKNIIYTGVAGTGKTYRLQQLAKQYSQVIQTVDNEAVLHTMVQSLTWRDVMCIVFWQNKQMGIELLTVAEIIQHEFFVAKAQVNNRQDSMKKVARELLAKYSNSNDVNKSATNEPFCYFCKSDDGNSDSHTIIDIHSVNATQCINSVNYWYLHDDVSVIESSLKNKFDDYCNSKRLGGTYHRYEFVSFHQSYGYDEFVEGIRPVIDETTGQMRYKIVHGIFLRLCQRASADPSNRYAVFIDEINRANVSQVFGELMSLIEPSKRSGQSNQLTMNLAYSGRKFSVPRNVDIYATMNTQDFSLVALDQAFRRRFQFIELLPDAGQLRNICDISGNPVSLEFLLTGLNQRICQNLGSQHQLGHAYFIDIKNIFQLVEVMTRQVLPQLLTNCQQQPALLLDILRLDGAPWLIHDSQHKQQQHGFSTRKFIINPVLSRNLYDIESNIEFDSLSFDNVVSQSTDNAMDDFVVELISANEEIQQFFMAESFIALYDT